MRQIHPAPADDVDPLDLYPADDRRSDGPNPWVMLNMVASVDGAIAIDGKSGGLGGDGDRAVFRAVRACADWILVAAGTARAEHYRRPDPDDEVRARRLATGRAARPRLAVVTASLNLPDSLPLLGARSGPDDLPALIITGRDAPSDAETRLRDHAEIVRLDQPSPTPAAILAELGSRGAEVVLAEGGPSFNGQLVDAGVVDEICLSTAPMLVGGTTPRIVDGAERAVAADLALDRLLEHDGALFARYLRR